MQMNPYQSASYSPQYSYPQYLYNPMQQMQQPQRQQVFGLSGKTIQAPENVMANDVPMDGSVAFFPMNDLSAIYAKSWNPDGTIRTSVFKPVLEQDPKNVSIDALKGKIGTSGDVTAPFMDKLDEVYDKLLQLEQLMAKPLPKVSASRSKKEDAE